MAKKIILKFCEFLFIVSLCVNISNGQVKLSNDSSKNKPSDCEYIKNRLDYAIINNNQRLNQYLILVFRLGNNEFSTHLNKVRISKIKKYIENKNYLSRTVFADGEKSDELGKLEIYVSGKLFSELFFIEGNKIDICIE